ncbi:efflux RND transporter periplasmic adaptor subunit [Leeuwenhoekiella sp. ZYFB001]|uniref:efflux RND transporter periplasmic adaptor subunit n=1 Tax=Leeuwenhoekiella sp. ZYFB001 TaxID=2719912 RepID=UPI0014302611|nr:efflux RND transporter periplasmic adaptor subunit [Leeuwenhoekiella sp. ZYFB001]
MKKIVAFSLTTLVLGLALGYFLFNTSEEAKEVPTHEHSEDTALWTCSMHPQILRNEPGDCPICGMDLIPTQQESAGLAVNQFRMTERAIALADIQTTVVGNSGEITSELKLSGTIAINDDQVATQPAHFDGRVERLMVTSVGQQVRRGQQVATIYSPELVAAQQELVTAAKLKDKQPKLYEAVRNKFKNWMISDALLDEIETTGNTVTRFPIYAHVAGVVRELMASEGAHIMDGNPIFKVANLNTVWAEFDAYEHQINQLKIGQDLEITTNAYPDQRFKAKISYIDPVLNSATRTVTVRATLTNPQEVLKPGMFIETKLMGSASEASAITVPASAVLWTGDRSLVYVKPKSDQSVFEMREVTLGTKSGDYYEVLNGLSPGTEIVTNGTFTVDAAAQLSGKKSMMHQGTGSELQETAPNFQLSEAFQKNLNAVLPSYFALKDAFVASDEQEVQKASETFREDIEALKVDGSSTEVQSLLATVFEQAAKISNSSALAEQREYFISLNVHLTPLVQNSTAIKPYLFVQRCPMANNSQGAIWLSNSDEIKNPYYGEAMLTCGSTMDTLGD